MTQTLTAVRRFAHVHDDLPAFHAGYLVLTLLVAALLNLGAFGLLIAAHMTLDFVKYREYHKFSMKRTLEGMVRESLVDVTLLSVGLLFAVYIHHTIGLAGMSGLLRAEVSLVSAAAMVLPKVKVLHNFLKVISHLRHYIDQVHPRFCQGWSNLDHFCFFAIEFSLILIAAAPLILGMDTKTLFFVLQSQLIPFHF
ncbi:hypothetical protein COU76_01215 [Candidatus Peregrinibacteria bacterium CG10_big_fil_rev_8_21_14_0_10_49_10]|nr:MAG: hypothetical protein COU76_01215 [Candidatus Peregrinibacteria bacterium CG10_big_fil_rev_8_21_14_0_10_49_10]